jgi:hypothetical protein
MPAVPPRQEDKTFVVTGGTDGNHGNHGNHGETADGHESTRQRLEACKALCPGSIPVSSSHALLTGGNLPSGFLRIARATLTAALYPRAWQRSRRR